MTTVVAVAAGFLVTLAGSRWLQPLLFQQSARDPVVYCAVGAMMIVVAGVAAAGPALRAAGADPNRALRDG